MKSRLHTALSAYPADVSQQVRPAAGIDKFLVELFVGNLLLAVPVLTVRENARKPCSRVLSEFSLPSPD